MKKLFFPVVAIVFTSLLVSCGGSSSKGSSGSEAQRQEEETDGMQGGYTATFSTMNPQVNGTIPGSVTMLRREDRLYAFVRLFAGGVSAWHMQYIYTGTRCPGPQDDTNGDSFIDINEAEAVMGKILIPLDSDVGTQMSGRSFFPLADPSGSYGYERVTSYNRFINDLRAVDRDPNDNMVKLAPDEKLNLSGRAVMIYGIAQTVELPDSVGTQGRRRPFQTLPIACGVFARTDGAMGGATGTGDTIPGPVAPVDESADRPAAPGEGEISSTGNYGSGNNDSDDGDTTNGGSDTDEETDPDDSGSEDGEDDDDFRWPWEH